MTLRDLDKIHQHFVTEIQQVRDFLTGTHQTITKKYSKSSKRFSPEEQKNLQLFLDRLKDKLEGKEEREEKIGLSLRVINHVMSVITGLKHSEFLAEMTLVYVMSFYEAFVKDYLKEILVFRRELLFSKKTLTFEEAASVQSIDELISYMAEKEVEGLAYESVDDLAKYFDDKLNINIVKTFVLWSIIREASYRRNIIVHNRGITNKIYCIKTGHKKIGEDLQTDIAYVIAVTDAVKAFLDFLHETVKRKFTKDRNRDQRET
jgi:hypothetical protein